MKHLGYSSVVFMTDLHLEFSHSPLHFEQLHVEGGLLTLECRDLLLYSRVLRLLMSVVPLHLLLDLEVLVSQCLSDILRFHGEHRLEGLLFRSQDLHLLLMILHLISQLQNHLFQCLKLSLEVSSVIVRLLGAHGLIQSSRFRSGHGCCILTSSSAELVVTVIHYLYY